MGDGVSVAGTETVSGVGSSAVESGGLGARVGGRGAAVQAARRTIKNPTRHFIFSSYTC
jgi:hypothetical protein